MFRIYHGGIGCPIRSTEGEGMASVALVSDARPRGFPPPPPKQGAGGGG